LHDELGDDGRPVKSSTSLGSSHTPAGRVK
jgi:hypothetical protein